MLKLFQVLAILLCVLADGKSLPSFQEEQLLNACKGMSHCLHDLEAPATQQGPGYSKVTVFCSKNGNNTMGCPAHKGHFHIDQDLGSSHIWFRCDRYSSCVKYGKFLSQQLSGRRSQESCCKALETDPLYRQLFRLAEALSAPEPTTCPFKKKGLSGRAGRRLAGSCQQGYTFAGGLKTFLKDFYDEHMDVWDATAKGFMNAMWYEFKEFVTKDAETYSDEFKAALKEWWQFKTRSETNRKAVSAFVGLEDFKDQVRDRVCTNLNDYIQCAIRLAEKHPQCTKARVFNEKQKFNCGAPPFYKGGSTGGAIPESIDIRSSAQVLMKLQPTADIAQDGDEAKKKTHAAQEEPKKSMMPALGWATPRKFLPNAAGQDTPRTESSLTSDGKIVRTLKTHGGTPPKEWTFDFFFHFNFVFGGLP
eukprot:TRINITY_DN51470_c0_g1_i1.p1 TRINITY_DN51470_c0_g1~~TRINITY_DN51470_c0_g1_i1.p1  ORF type:complete len:445 (+),score=45.22 TRINITY_DN51470_c0_g1_i1:79-1335(+)